MKSSAIVVAVAACALATTTSFASAQPTKGKARPVAKHQVWSPHPYVAGENLPSNFRGLDPKRLWSLVKAKQPALEKGEYETTAEYNQRLAASTSSMAPLVPSDEYALLLEGTKPKYDADAQEFGVLEPIFCRKASEYGKSEHWVTCAVGSVSQEDSQYVASNAYGTKAKVISRTGKELAIAVREDSSFLDSAVFAHDAYVQGAPIFELKTSFAVPIEQARNLQSSKIGLLLVGRFDALQFIEGHATTISPTIDRPYAVYISQDAIPFTPTKLVLYVEGTGVVLGEKDL